MSQEIYDLHNLIKIKSNRKLRRFEKFVVEDDSIDPDVEVIFGNFKPDLSGYTKIGKFWIGKHSLYCEGHYNATSYRIWFRDIESRRTTIHIQGGTLFSNEIFYVYLLEPFLMYKLTQKGILLIHAASLTINGRGIIISAETGIGKTSTLLSLLLSDGSEYYADDQSIVKGDTLYSYPMPIGIRTHVVLECGLKLKARDNFIIALHNLINVISFYYGKLNHKVRIEDIRYNCRVNGIDSGVRSQIRQIFILTLSNDMCVSELKPEQALDRLIIHNRPDEEKQKLFFKFFTMYKAVYPEFDHWNNFNKLLANLVQNDIKFYEIRLKRKFNVNETVREIMNIVNVDLGGVNTAPKSVAKM